ncbi:LppP/LprE family lipoprotein [Streptomyces sp. J2-1]|nr:LppP/LprE family lipoprotein [Streptomyces corallincola]
MIVALAGIAALALFVAACGTGGTGARDEGPAHASAVAGAVPSPPPSPSESYRRVDAVALIKKDPAVSETVKRELKPCSGHDYPVDVSYGHLTGSTADDVVVNVLTCADAVGIGSYVYQDVDGVYRNVFHTEESPVYAEIDQDTLTVTKQVYKKDDPITAPSGEDVITYDWKGGRFVEGRVVHTDYGSAAGADPSPEPSG